MSKETKIETKIESSDDSNESEVIHLPSTADDYQEIEQMMYKDIDEGKADALPDILASEAPEYLKEIVADRHLHQDEKRILLEMAKQVEDRNIKGRDFVYRTTRGVFDLTLKAYLFWFQRRGGYRMTTDKDLCGMIEGTNQYQMVVNIEDTLNNNTATGTDAISINEEKWSAKLSSNAQRNALKKVIPELAMIGIIKIFMRMEELTRLEDKQMNVLPLIEEHQYRDEIYECIKLRYKKDFNKLEFHQLRDLEKDVRRPDTVKSMLKYVVEHHRLKRLENFKMKFAESTGTTVDTIDKDAIYKDLSSYLGRTLDDLKRYTLEQIFCAATEETLVWLESFNFS